MNDTIGSPTTTPEPELSDRERKLLVGLADGTLAGRHRKRAETRIERIPDGAALVERQRRVAGILRNGPAPPASLTEPITVRGRAPRSAHRVRVATSLAAVTVAAGALAAGLLLTVFQGGATNPTPTVFQAANVGFRPALDPAPRSRPGHPGLVAASFAGVSYPNWSRSFGWHTTGARSDRISGRPTETVFYGHMGHRIGYTVVSGPPIRLPAGGQRLERNGVPITVYGEHMHAIAVFVRNGRTCILSAHVAHRATLVKLAGWKGDGAIRF
jgi:hypothetical protein